MAEEKSYWLGEVRTAEDGNQALEMLKASPETGWTPHLIVLDLRMPEMNGLEFLQRCRSSSEFSDIPILVLSGSDSPQDIFDSYAGRADGFIEKPNGFAELENVFKQIRRVWKKTRAKP